jgi:hypothetical protein
MAVDLADRFWAKVDTLDLDGCWPWTGSRSPKGYGQFMWSDRKPKRAQRIAYTFAFKPIPAGLLVCHACDTPACCNPEHLFLGTHKDNTADMVRKGRAKGAQGVVHRAARLTEEQVRQIRAADGPNCEIAVRFGISDPHVSNIRARKKWKHLS